MASVESVLNHLVLPAKLPGQPDEDEDTVGYTILTRLIRACETIDSLKSQKFSEAWYILRKALGGVKISQSRLEKTSVLGGLSGLRPNGLLLLPLLKQNAALLIRRCLSEGIEYVIFEVFEASPTTTAVLAAEGALQWEFPGRAARISIEVFLDGSFQNNLATFLEQASMESLSRFEARTVKAKVSVTESRDTADPALVVQMLMPLLEALGSPAAVPKIRKRIRDDVNIEEAEHPWRRLPLWLVLRVTTQLHLQRALGNCVGRACYKFVICTMLTQLLEDCAGQVAPEITLTLRSKICRRLAKLETDKSSPSSAVYRQLFDLAGPMMKQAIDRSTEQVELAWARYRRSITRPIPIMPSRASERDLILSLPNSFQYLNNCVKAHRAQRQKHVAVNDVPSYDGAMEQVRDFASRCYRAAQMERDIETREMSCFDLTTSYESKSIQLTRALSKLFATIGDTYDSNPEQMSIFILHVFELWVELDECVAEACPLVLEYHPVFTAELLDVLQLSTHSEMARLQAVQLYLQERCADCIHDKTTILSNPGPDCFAVQYVERSSRLIRLREKIGLASQRSRTSKESDWEQSCEDYERHSRAISEGTCVCSHYSDGRRDVRGCTKCWHWRARKKMTISPHEDFLPADSAENAAVIFELGIPEYLAAYRDAVWKIMSKLGHPGKPQKTTSPPVRKLRDCNQLKEYTQFVQKSISLASTTKVFLQAHYKQQKMKVDLSQLLLPLGAKFMYFEEDTALWLGDLNRPLTFHHLCGIHIPKGLQKSGVIPTLLHPLSLEDGPSSYKIMANLTKCPAEMSVHEFMAYQRLLSGKNTRWMTMLVELGSSNLNFSSEDTMLVFSQLAQQAGPSADGCGTLRDIHQIFRDRSFCTQLIEQIDSRLRSIASNWREAYYMDMLITLSLRLSSLTVGCGHESAARLIKAARSATLQWIIQLRGEIRKTRDTDSVRNLTRYCFWAALLCRRTFSTYVEHEHGLSGEDVHTFAQASLALQENLTVDISELPQSLRKTLVRDLKLAHQIRVLVQQAIGEYPDKLCTAINETWSEQGTLKNRTYSKWEGFSPPWENWVTSTTTASINDYPVSQTVHFNFVEGHLLVNGKPLGRLPREFRTSEDVRELFQDRHLLTFPSPLGGMSHVMAGHVEGNEIHFGLRRDRVVILALTPCETLEFIPRRVFAANGKFDLPASLLDNCVHWLNLDKRVLEIRRRPYIWKTRKSDWKINLISRMAQRNEKSNLVDPQSDLFARVVGIFRHFEDPYRLTVFQPIKGKLSVELRHLDLSFFVNKNGFLECRELQEEIDPDQDAGTFYGLESKIILRSVADAKKRCIIVPMDGTEYQRHGMHVAVRSCSTTAYCRFAIDNVLGRLSCPPEPRLLYLKARFHAYTSFALPDPLTGRTGAEEALNTLSSGCAQPWNSLGDSPILILKDIKRLSPTREYYPRDIKRLQRVHWNKNLTAEIQQDAYEAIVDNILRKSNRLKVFETHGTDVVTLDVEDIGHLRRRGNWQRALYQRVACSLAAPEGPNDKVYSSRDRHLRLLQATNVHQTVKQILRSPFHAIMSDNIADVLGSWTVIGGFRDSPDDLPHSLDAKIETDSGESWGCLVSFCCDQRPQVPYDLIFRLALMSFGTKADMDAIGLLAAFGCMDELKDLPRPACSSFINFRPRETPTTESLWKTILVDYPIVLSFQSRHRRDSFEDDNRAAQEAEAKRLADFLMRQWPSSAPSTYGFDSRFIEVETALERILPEWLRLYQNAQLSAFIDQAQLILNRRRGAKDDSKPQQWTAGEPKVSGAKYAEVVPLLAKELFVKGWSLQDFQPPVNTLKAERTNVLQNTSSTLGHNKVPIAATPSREMVDLGKILNKFAKSSSEIRHRYGEDLIHSLSALRNSRSFYETQEPKLQMNIVEDCIKDVRVSLQLHLKRIQEAISSREERFKWLRRGNLWPCLTPIALLEQLRSGSCHFLEKNVLKTMIVYGIVITQLQWLLRIKRALLRGDMLKVAEEWKNYGHENWSPQDYPDWLLLEIDSDIMIRPEQIEVAKHIISPKSGDNSVVQMNMGKGKTSCIVPMAAAVLANTKQLMRLIVPKALLLQTAQTLQSRLGGLVGREVRHIPFSRRTKTTEDTLRLYISLHREALQVGGILITTPDYILSFDLSGQQRIVDTKLAEAKVMTKFQSWLASHCRDVLDESDFTLAVKTQLIYPSGPQLSVDGHPYRWKCMQTLLSLVEDHLPDLKRDFQQRFEVYSRPGGFPTLHLLGEDVEDALNQRIASQVCNGRTPFLRLLRPTTTAEKDEIMHVLLKESLDSTLLERALEFFVDEPSARVCILLIRGLLLNKILLICLKKRWNIQYGLHPKRDPIAVPFDAKGVPSEQAEFGHPDVSIMLTCLAFYYSGLNLSQFSQDLQQVLQANDPAAEYDRWTGSCETLPDSLRHWNVINIDDKSQVYELWGHLRLSRSVLDHFMNNFVFPAHAKQFGVKLQASGWDLPLSSQMLPDQKRLCQAKTTGFSGTNDNRMMLPLTITQDDLENAQQTNAEVLTYLLEPRNRQYVIATQYNRRFSERELLQRMKIQQIRILIDAGAYILEMDNKTLARTWLEVDSEAKGAAYFGADNRMWVLYRAKKDAVPLLATPFADNFDGCLVYLDEAHTRGVDLKLPQKACGALTLAPGQTKDHTVQAAMRLRLLGSTQSVVFFSPPEVHQSLLDVCDKQVGDEIDSSHVIEWLLEQTCRGNEQLHSLYLAQGEDFCRRKSALWKNSNWLVDKDQRKALLRVIQHPERLTLEELYGVAQNESRVYPTDMSNPYLQEFAKALKRQKISAREGGTGVHTSALEEVEQEREVEFQVEEVRHVQKPPHFEALGFPGLHAAIERFAVTGRLTGESGYEHAFEVMARTSVGKKYRLRRTASPLYASAEYARTTKPRGRSTAENFLRLVEWVLWSPTSGTALILIPEEAELLVPLLRSRNQPMAHLLTYAAPVTKGMLHFNKLSYYALPSLPQGYAVPSWLPTELGIFAGRLYVDFAELEHLVELLQLAGQGGTKGSESTDRRDRAFAENPPAFLLEWLALRRNGQDVANTPMGYICQGRPLREDHPFFASRRAYSKKPASLIADEKIDAADTDSEDDNRTSTEPLHAVEAIDA